MDSRYGAIVLCGGDSRRMGQDKALMPFGAESMLQRTVRIVGKVVPPQNVVVVAGADQELPALPADTRIVRDGERSRGPLPALLLGLCTLPRLTDAAFVAGCDAPLLKSELVEWLLKRLAQLHDPAAVSPVDAIVPSERQCLHALCAAYRRTCRVAIAAAARIGEQSLQGVITSRLINAELVPVDALRSADPNLDSLVNCNTPQEYETAPPRRSRRNWKSNSPVTRAPIVGKSHRVVILEPLPHVRESVGVERRRRRERLARRSRADFAAIDEQLTAFEHHARQLEHRLPVGVGKVKCHVGVGANGERCLFGQAPRPVPARLA